MTEKALLKKLIMVDGATLRRNLKVLFLFALVVAAVDQWTKSWADQNLATRRHPIPVQAKEATSLTKLIQAELGMNEQEVKALIDEAFVALLARDGLTDPAARPYPVRRPALARIVYVFTRGLDQPPRLAVFYHRNERLADARAKKGLALDAGERKRIDDEMAEMTFAQALREFVPSRSDSALEDLIRDGRVFSTREGTRPTVETKLEPGDIVLIQRKATTVIPGFLSFNYAENPGAAWSFLADASPKFRYWFFTLISVFAVLFLLALAVNQKREDFLPICAYGLILGGAIGNFIDRQKTNYVIDFIDMYIGSSHWPTYNVADIGISVGVSLLLLVMFLDRNKSKDA